MIHFHVCFGLYKMIDIPLIISSDEWQNKAMKVVQGSGID